MALQSPCSLFYIICNFCSHALLFYITLTSKASLTSSAPFALRLASSWLLLFLWTPICLRNKADNLTLLFAAGREQARGSGDEQWEHSVGSLFSPHPSSLQCHHPSPRHWDTPQRNRHTDSLSSVFITQKGRTTSSKVAEKRIRESFSLKFWIFWIFPPGNKPIIFQRKH